MREEKIKKIIVRQKEEFLAKKNFFHRQKEEKIFKNFLKMKEILVVTGLRRTGKSTLLRLIWQKLSQEKKVEEKQFLYLNFEDVRMIDFIYQDFEKVMDLYLELEEPDEHQSIYLFFDEIQNIKNWEKWLYALYETGKYKIFVIGSNATLLSSEIATALTGRNIQIILYPLSFWEYVTFFQQKQIDKKSFYQQKKVTMIKKIWKKFLETGGLPEIAKTNSSELIQEYFKNILWRDIVNRYNIKHKKELSDLAHLLMTDLGQVVSLKKLGNAVALKNISTVRNYLKYLQDSFLFFSVPLFSFSYKEQVYNPDKYYLIDHGFFQKISFQFSENKGKILENIVAVELLRQQKEIFYFRSSKQNLEVDFVVKKGKKIETLIQVTWSLENQRTREREINSLLTGMQELQLESGLILTADEEDEFQKNGKKIKVIPIWKWLLEK